MKPLANHDGEHGATVARHRRECVCGVPLKGAATPRSTPANAHGDGTNEPPSSPSGSSIGQAAPPHTDATAAEGGGTAGPAVVVSLPLHVAPVGNRREHPMARARRTRREISIVAMALGRHEPPLLPVVVLLMRTGWNRLDVDGLVSSMKGPIDAVAQWLGVDDRDRRLRWHLAQATTRKRRLTRGRWGAACSLGIAVRPWQPSDGEDLLRVLAAVPIEWAET